MKMKINQMKLALVLSALCVMLLIAPTTAKVAMRVSPLFSYPYCVEDYDCGPYRSCAPNGTCVCTAGWGGSACKDCLSDASCDPGLLGRTVCNSTTKRCECTSSYYGPSCSLAPGQNDSVISLGQIVDDNVLNAQPWVPFAGWGGTGVEHVEILGGGGGSTPHVHLVRFSQNADLFYHAHPDYEHVFALVGEPSDFGATPANSRMGPTPPGSLIINKPNTAHSMRGASTIFEGAVLVIAKQPAELCPTSGGGGPAICATADAGYGGIAYVDYLRAPQYMDTLSWTTWSGAGGGGAGAPVTQVMLHQQFANGTGQFDRILKFATNNTSITRTYDHYEYIFVSRGGFADQYGTTPQYTFNIYKPGVEHVFTAQQNSILMSLSAGRADECITGVTCV